MSKHTHLSTVPFSPSLALAISPSNILDFHRARFGDLRMEGTDGGKADDAGDGGKDDAKTDSDKEKGKDDGGDAGALGEPGKRALKAEREAREKAERETKAVKDQMDSFFGGLKGLLGGDDGKKADPVELIETLRGEIGGLKHTNLVDSVARSHKITDETDLGHLRSAKDEDAMRSLAKRLAPKDTDDEPDDKDKRKRTPRPDSSQGKGGGADSAKPSSVSQVMADRRAARAEKAKQ